MAAQKEIIGQVCIKTMGKERNMPCIIVDIIDDKFVIVDGLVKRRRCNINHLKFSGNVIKLKQYTKDSILNAFVKEGILTKEKLEKIKKKEGIIKARKKVKKSKSTEKGNDKVNEKKSSDEKKKKIKKPKNKIKR